MFKLLGNKKLFFLMIGIILFIAIMGISLGKRYELTWPEKFVKDSVSFTQGIIYKPAASIAGFFEEVRSLRVLYEENKRLKLTLSQYARDKVKLNYLESENERLKKKLDFTERQKAVNKYKFHIAQVVSQSPDPYNGSISINLGKKDGMKVDMSVQTEDGLIGRISFVSEFYSTVQLITDMNAKVNNSKSIAVTVLNKEEKSFGMIESYSEEIGMLQMTMIAPEDPIAVGDTVITSGLGEVFPRGIIVGKVDSIKVGDFGITRTATIRPASDFTHLQEVFVVEVPKF